MNKKDNQKVFFGNEKVTKLEKQKGVDKIFSKVCSNGAFILQKDLESFEEDLSKYVGCKHAIGVADGTNAILLGLQALEIGLGDEVIISPHTYIATAAAIKMSGATPVFADIGSDNLLCPNSAKQQITNKTKAIMPTQLNGRCADMDLISNIAKENNILVLEDSAQGLGAKYKGKSAGTFGPFGTLSFYPAKLIGCFGDGGAILTNNDLIAEKIYLSRDHGRDIEGNVIAWGTNCRLDNLQAAFLKFRLSKFDEDVRRRREIASMYNRGLKNIYQIRLPPSPDSDQSHFDVYQNYEITADKRDKLKEYLKQKGISTIKQWGGKAVHHFDELGFGQKKYTHLSNTNNFFNRCLMLPMNMSLTNPEVLYIIEKIRNFYRKKA